MTKLYLMPSNQPADGQTGGFTRRNVSWKYLGSESDGTEHIIRLLSTDYESFDVVNQHILYLEKLEAPGENLTIINGDFQPWLFDFDLPELPDYIRFCLLRLMPSAEIMQNPAEYSFEFNNTLLTFVGSAADNGNAWGWESAGSPRSMLSFSGSSSDGGLYLSHEDAAISSQYLLNFSVKKNGLSLGSASLLFMSTDEVSPRDSVVVVSNISGNVISITPGSIYFSYG